MIEEWRDIPGYEGYYQASCFGQIRSIPRIILRRDGQFRKLPGIIRKQSLSGDINKGQERLSVPLSKNGKHVCYKVHRLILLTFVGPCPEGMEGCHNDGDHYNNHVSNLRWDTPSENLFDRVRHGTHHQANKTHCPANHEYSEENTYIAPGTNRRECRTCKRSSALASYHRNKKVIYNV